jgi:chromosome segregation ATPase
LAKKNAQCDTRNGDQSGMMQMGLQIGEKFGELKKENEGLKDGMNKMMKAFEELKKANDELKVENAEKYKEMEEMKEESANGMAKMSKIFEELHEKVGKLVEENSKMKVENVEKGHEMERMKKEIDGLKVAKAVDEEHRAFEELKEENRCKLREIAELIAAEFDKQIAGLKGKIVEKESKIEKLEAEFNGFKNGIDEKNIELEEKIIRLKVEEEKLKEKICELQGQIGELVNFILQF